MKINPEKCIQCGKCTTVCPIKIFVLQEEESVPQIYGPAMSRCLRCGHCMAICPVQAISIPGLAYEAMEEVQEMTICKESMNDYIRNRRSIRNYNDEIIEDATLQEFLNVIQWKSSAHNQQTVHWKIVRGKDQVEKITKKIIEIIEADPFYNDLVADYYRGKNSLTRNASHILIAHLPKKSLVPIEDATVAITYAEILAPSYGMGSCLSGYLTLIGQRNDAVKKLLGIPEDHILGASLLIGYPEDEKYMRIPSREKAVIDYLEI